MGNTINKSNIVLAVDLGGTKIRSAIVNRNGEILSVSNLKTNADRGPQYIIDRLVQSLEGLLKKNSIKRESLSGVSIAIAGPVDVDNGILTESPHLPGWHNMPLRNIILERMRLKTIVDNDVNAAAFGEYYYGNVQKVKNLIYMAIGTGLGGGIIINGRLYRGADGSAGEIGHMIIKENGPKCSCGNHGCLEALCAGTAIEREIREKLEKVNDRKVSAIFGKDINNITARDVGNAANKGDPMACEVIGKAACYLGIGIGNVINIFNPEMIVLGGGVSKTGDIFIKPAIDVALQTAFKLPARTVKIVQSSLGDDAGILGAAALMWTGK